RLGKKMKDQAPGLFVDALAERTCSVARTRAIKAFKAGERTFPRETAFQNELKRDVIRAIDVQSALLPECGLCLTGWETYSDYAPAGCVGGDYCDLIETGNGDLYFFFGDAVGKGIMGSMIVSQLYALFRSLLSVGLPLSQMFDRGNRLFCESMAT